MPSSFPAHQAQQHDQSTNLEYLPSATAGQTLAYGEFVTLSGASAIRAGADPTVILGISEVDSEKAKTLTPNGKIPIRVLNEATVLCMSSATDPVEATHRNQQYGITRSGTTGFWQVDTAKTGATARVEVIEVDPTQGKWYVRVIAQYLAAGTIIS